MWVSPSNVGHVAAHIRTDIHGSSVHTSCEREDAFADSHVMGINTQSHIGSHKLTTVTFMTIHQAHRLDQVRFSFGDWYTCSIPDTGCSLFDIKSTCMCGDQCSSNMIADPCSITLGHRVCFDGH